MWTARGSIAPTMSRPVYECAPRHTHTNSRIAAWHTNSRSAHRTAQAPIKIKTKSRLRDLRVVVAESDLDQIREASEHVGEPSGM